MRTQWTTKGNRDAGSSCLCDWGLHRYLQNFGGGFEHPKPPPLGTPLHSLTHSISRSLTYIPTRPLTHSHTTRNQHNSAINGLYVSSKEVDW